MNKPAEQMQYKMDSRDGVLTPWHKWEAKRFRLRYFPWAFPVHVVLVALTTLMVCMFNTEDAQFLRVQKTAWFKYFHPSGIEHIGHDDSWDPNGPPYYIYGVDDAINGMKSAIDNYFNIVCNGTSVTQVGCPSEEVILMANAYQNTPVAISKGGSTTTETIRRSLKSSATLDSLLLELAESGAGDVYQMFHSLTSLSLTFKMHTYDIGRVYPSTLAWTVVLTYNSFKSGPLKPVLSVTVAEATNSFSHNVHDVRFWAQWVLNAAILVCTILHEFLLCKATRSQSRKLYRILCEVHGISLNSRRAIITKVLLPIAEKNFFWTLTVANLCNLIACSLSLSIGVHSLALLTVQHKLLLAIAVFGLWISLVRWLAHKEKAYVLVRTLSKGVPKVCMFILGTFPILIGYAFFGIVYFADYSARFADLQAAVITLFSITNGDVIRESFSDITSPYPIVGSIYLYSFICLFIYVVLSVFIVIMEHAYEEVLGLPTSSLTNASSSSSSAANLSASAAPASSKSNIPRPSDSHVRYYVAHAHAHNHGGISSMSATHGHQHAHVQDGAQGGMATMQGVDERPVNHGHSHDDIELDRLTQEEITQQILEGTVFQPEPSPGFGPTLGYRTPSELSPHTSFADERDTWGRARASRAKDDDYHEAKQTARDIAVAHLLQGMGSQHRHDDVRSAQLKATNRRPFRKRRWGFGLRSSSSSAIGALGERGVPSRKSHAASGGSSSRTPLLYEHRQDTQDHLAQQMCYVPTVHTPGTHLNANGGEGVEVVMGADTLQLLATLDNSYFRLKHELLASLGQQTQQSPKASNIHTFVGKNRANSRAQKEGCSSRAIVEDLQHPHADGYEGGRINALASHDKRGPTGGCTVNGGQDSGGPTGDAIQGGAEMLDSSPSTGPEKLASHPQLKAKHAAPLPLHQGCGCECDEVGDHAGCTEVKLLHQAEKKNGFSRAQLCEVVAAQTAAFMRIRNALQLTPNSHDNSSLSSSAAVALGRKAGIASTPRMHRAHQEWRHTVEERDVINADKYSHERFYGGQEEDEDYFRGATKTTENRTLCEVSNTRNSNEPANVPDRPQLENQGLIKPAVTAVIASDVITNKSAAADNHAKEVEVRVKRPQGQKAKLKMSSVLHNVCDLDLSNRGAFVKS